MLRYTYIACLVAFLHLYQNIEFLTLECRPRCAVLTFNSSQAANLGALYGSVGVHMLPASLRCTDL